MTNQQLRAKLLREARSNWDKPNGSRFICDNISETAYEYRSLKTATELQIDHVAGQLYEHIKTTICGTWSVDDYLLSLDPETKAATKAAILECNHRPFVGRITDELNEKAHAFRVDMWDTMIALNEDGVFDEENKDAFPSIQLS